MIVYGCSRGSERHYDLKKMCSHLQKDCNAYSSYLFYCCKNKRHMNKPNTTCAKCKHYEYDDTWHYFIQRQYYDDNASVLSKM